MQEFSSPFKRIIWDTLGPTLEASSEPQPADARIFQLLPVTPYTLYEYVHTTL